MSAVQIIQRNAHLAGAVRLDQVKGSDGVTLARATFVANSDSYGDIEALTVSGTGSGYAFPDLSESGRLLRAVAAESEAMPDVATNAFPLLYADQSGYYIVERAGLTVMRMQDSGTGINKIELHVRKRVGGRPVETWKGAVQQILS